MARRLRRKRHIWPLFLTEQEMCDAAYVAGGRKSRVRRAIEAGELQGFREHAGARWLYDTAEFVAWVKHTFEKRI